MPPIPAWIHDQFRQQQHRLLVALWGRGAVDEATLCRALKFNDPTTAADNLRRRVTQTNTGLTEKAAHTAGRWEIGQQRRDRVLHYFLRPVSGSEPA